ncbi:hypothetical protein D3C73_1321240 [compost metagenome]
MFKQAALSAVDDDTEEWLELSEGFSQNGASTFLSRYVYKEKSEGNQAKRSLLLSRIEKLEAFNEFNNELLRNYQEELDKLSRLIQGH